MVGNGAMANLRTIRAALPCRCPPGCDRDCAPPPTTTSGSVRSPRKSCHYGPRWACKCWMRASDISDGSSVQTQNLSDARPSPHGIYGAGLLLRRTQGGDEIIELGGDLAPLGQPVARKPQHDVGSADAPLRQADAGRGAGATA